MTDANVQRIKQLDIWKSTVAPVPLTGGLSNQSYRVEDDGHSFVVRFGVDYPFHHVSRERELMNARAAFAAGIAPAVVHAEAGLMVSRYVESRTYDGADVVSDIERVAALVRDFHESMLPEVTGPGFMFWVFHVVRDYANTLDRADSSYRPELSRYLDLNRTLERLQTPLPIIYGHNDLLPANILDDGRRLWLIDFEYAGFGTSMFDLAGIASNAQCDAKTSKRLLTAYFDEEPSDDLLRGHAAMQCASLLREAMWSMVSELYLETPGVDFKQYTAQNLELLWQAVDDYSTRYDSLPT